MKNASILVAEDDVHIREGLVDTLESEGYRVTAVADGDACLAAWRRDTFDLVLLDIMMPGKSGYDVCRIIRGAAKQTPIVMLTAKTEEIDKVIGLELGADDYITKPFGVRELLARIRAVRRRAEPPAPEAENALPDRFPFGAAEIDRRALRAVRGTDRFELTPRELKLVEYFASRPGVALTRRNLLRAVWGYDYFGTTRTVDQHIAQLRKKVEPDPKQPSVITTVHGLGYRYEAPDDKAHQPQ